MSHNKQFVGTECAEVKKSSMSIASPWNGPWCVILQFRNWVKFLKNLLMLQSVKVTVRNIMKLCPIFKSLIIFSFWWIILPTAFLPNKNISEKNQPSAETWNKGSSSMSGFPLRHWKNGNPRPYSENHTSLSSDYFSNYAAKKFLTIRNLDVHLKNRVPFNHISFS